jgi:organic radical activating enzyme
MQLNNQPIEKKCDNAGDVDVDVHSIFYTIQGEGPFCGTPALFIRLAGCNLQCPLCDTDYTSRRFTYDPDTLAQTAMAMFPRTNTGSKLVVITGGEPFRQNIAKLLENLIRLGAYVQIETNGTLPPPRADVDWNINTGQRRGVYIVVSPKTGKVNSTVETLSCAYKYVVREGHIADDGLPFTALDHTAHPQVARPPSKHKTVYIQPVDEQEPHANQGNLNAAIDSCMAHGYILQLQVHKIIDLD